MTVSAGVAGLDDPACRPDQVFELADQALYRAKEDGRNRVEVHARRRRGRGDAIRAADRRRRPDDPPHAVGAARREPTGFELVGEAEDADQAIELAARRRPDVVVLDFDMPGGGGVRAATEIREASPTTRIVALSADGSQAAQYDMSRAGAVGYVVKGAPDERDRPRRSAARALVSHRRGS